MKLNRFCAVLSVCALAVAACGGSSGGDGKAEIKNAVLASVGETITNGLSPERDGFAFPNFGAGASAEQLDGADLLAMFGGSSDVRERPDWKLL